MRSAMTRRAVTGRVQVDFLDARGESRHGRGPPFWPSGPLLSMARLPDAADYLTLMPTGSFPVPPAQQRAPLPSFAPPRPIFDIRYSPFAIRYSLFQAIARHVLYAGPEAAPGLCARLPRRAGHERKPVLPKEAILGEASVVLHNANPLSQPQLRPKPQPRPVARPPKHRAKRSQTNSSRHARRSRAPPQPPAWITQSSAARNRFRPA